MRKLSARTALVAALALGQAAVAIAADTYVNEAKQFEVTIPDGWNHVAGEGGPVDLVLTSPRFETTMGLCILISRDIADTRKDSQAKIDNEAGVEITDDFWRAVATDKTSKVTSVASKSEMRNGRRVYFATVGVTGNVKGKEVSFQMDLVLHLMPGKGMMGQCGVEIAQLDVEKADIQTVINSFNSTGTGVIAKLGPWHRTENLSHSLTDTLRAGARDMVRRMTR